MTYSFWAQDNHLIHKIDSKWEIRVLTHVHLTSYRMIYTCLADIYIYNWIALVKKTTYLWSSFSDFSFSSFLTAIFIKNGTCNDAITIHSRHIILFLHQDGFGVAWVEVVDEEATHLAALLWGWQRSRGPRLECPVAWCGAPWFGDRTWGIKKPQLCAWFWTTKRCMGIDLEAKTPYKWVCAFLLGVF